MDEKGKQQESNASASVFYDLPGEPAVVINGTPDIIPIDSTIPPHNASSAAGMRGPSGLGELLEGRDVQKWFMGRYYSGNVIEFDKETGWYRVFYEDGDSEDLDWQELGEVLAPLAVTVQLKAMAQRIVRKSMKSVHKSGKSVARSQNPQIKRRTTKGK